MHFSLLRRMMAPFKDTPLHPQWLIFRNEQASRHQIGNLAFGITLDIGAGRQKIREYLSDEVIYIALDYFDIVRASDGYTGRNSNITQ